jgi:hypothetical protein
MVNDLNYFTAQGSCKLLEDLVGDMLVVVNKIVTGEKLCASWNGLKTMKIL